MRACGIHLGRLHVLQLASQVFLGPTEPRLHRSDGNSFDDRDLGERQLLNLSEDERRPLFERQPIQRGIKAAPHLAVCDLRLGRRRAAWQLANVTGCPRPPLQKVAAAVASNRQQPRRKLRPLRIERADGSIAEATLMLRIDTPIEIEYYKNGGILPYVLRQLVA